MLDTLKTPSHAEVVGLQYQELMWRLNLSLFQWSNRAKRGQVCVEAAETFRVYALERRYRLQSISRRTGLLFNNISLVSPQKMG